MILRQNGTNTLRSMHLHSHFCFKKLCVQPKNIFSSPVNDVHPPSIIVDIPPGFKLAGIRFRSAEVITKDDCIYMLKDMTTDLKQAGGQEVCNELD